MRRFCASKVEFVPQIFETPIAAPIPYDEPAARIYASYRTLARRIGRGLGTTDGMIAAICASRGAPLATRNVADFDFLSIAVINPWES